MLLVMDANEIFSALIAKSKSLEILFNSQLSLVAPEYVLEEIYEHEAELVEKSKLNKENLNIFLMILTSKITFFRLEEYAGFLSDSVELCKDKDDIDYFALALKLNCSIWSEDKDMKKQSKIKIYSTKELIEEVMLNR